MARGYGSIARSTDEPMPPVPREGLLPDWLPEAFASRYVGYLQQYTHNINLAMFMLDVTDPAGMAVRAVDLDEDGLTGVVVLELGGTRVTLESAQTRFHGWEEHTQVYFEGGWVHAWSPTLFASPGNPKIEIYDADILAIPSDKLLIVHVNDYEDRPVEELRDGHRLHVGHGILPLDRYMQLLKQIGYDGYLSVEIFREEYWAQPVDQVVRDTKAALDAWIAR